MFVKRVPTSRPRKRRSHPPQTWNWASDLGEGASSDLARRSLGTSGHQSPEYAGVASVGEWTLRVSFRTWLCLNLFSAAAS